MLNDDCADCPVEPVLPAENALTPPNANEAISSNALIGVAVVLECSMAAELVIVDCAISSYQQELFLGVFIVHVDFRFSIKSTHDVYRDKVTRKP